MIIEYVMPNPFKFEIEKSKDNERAPNAQIKKQGDE